MSIETKSTEDRVVLLAAANSDTSKYLSDQLMAQYGTTRISEIRAIIGDTGVPFEKLLNEHIDSL